MCINGWTKSNFQCTQCAPGAAVATLVAVGVVVAVLVCLTTVVVYVSARVACRAVARFTLGMQLTTTPLGGPVLLLLLLLLPAPVLGASWCHVR